jgi:hypothetical protein
MELVSSLIVMSCANGCTEVSGLFFTTEFLSTHLAVYRTNISLDNAYTSIKLIEETTNTFVR